MKYRANLVSVCACVFASAPLSPSRFQTPLWTENKSENRQYRWFVSRWWVWVWGAVVEMRSHQMHQLRRTSAPYIVILLFYFVCQLRFFLLSLSPLPSLPLSVFAVCRCMISVIAPARKNPTKTFSCNRFPAAKQRKWKQTTNTPHSTRHPAKANTKVTARMPMVRMKFNEWQRISVVARRIRNYFSVYALFRV